MKRLGIEADSRKKLQDLLDHATSQLNSGNTTGFYTSRPAISVFDDDSREQNLIQCKTLIGLACKGLGQFAEARTAFADVLAHDPHHWEASQELQELAEDQE
jgi:hypothetical protein